MNPVLSDDLIPALDTESRKLTSLGPNRLLLLAPAVVAVVATLITALVAGPVTAESQPITGNATIGLYLGVVAALLAGAVLGAGLTGGEFQRGEMTMSVLFAPDTDRLLAAKYLTAAAFTAGAALLAEIVSVVALLVAGRGDVEYGLTIAEVLGAGILAAAAWAVIGAGFGLLLRSASIPIVLIAGWVFAVEPMLWLVTHAAGIPGVVTVLPGAATVGAVAVGSFTESGLFAPAPAALVILLLWAAAVGAGGWWALRRREL